MDFYFHGFCNVLNFKFYTMVFNVEIQVQKLFILKYMKKKRSVSSDLILEI